MRWNNGTRWQEATDMRMRTLAEERAWETHPHLEDVWKEHDGTMELTFGSSSANLTLGVVDSEAKALFAHGYCVILALKLHELTGLPLVLFTNSGLVDNDWSGHAAVRAGDDKFLDITGIRNLESINHAYWEDFTPVEVSREEFCTITIYEEYADDPFGFLDELEKLVVTNFARLVSKENSIPVLAN